MLRHPSLSFFFFFNDTATTEIYTLSLHDALPICAGSSFLVNLRAGDYGFLERTGKVFSNVGRKIRSEEHTSELQSHLNLVCRLLLEKKKKKQIPIQHDNTHNRYERG